MNERASLYSHDRKAMREDSEQGLLSRFEVLGVRTSMKECYKGFYITSSPLYATL